MDRWMGGWMDGLMERRDGMDGWLVEERKEEKEREGRK